MSLKTLITVIMFLGLTVFPKNLSAVEIEDNGLAGIDEIVFVKRHTYQSSHFYTDYIDGCVFYGGNICVLSLKTGKVREVVPSMREGIFGRYDISFDAKKIVFDWKASKDVGFRIYEVGVGGTGLRQITFPPADEDERIKKYDNSFLGLFSRSYNHHTDDMHPCYLPDGGIIFTSTRAEFGTLCDYKDQLTTPVLYRMGGDGKNMQKLTNSPVSEFSPSIMADGRVLYSRWEYVDKGKLFVKCLWAMRPDGTGSVEIYGNNIKYPPSFLHGRQIPGHENMFVFLGTPHYPQSGIGTVIRIDTSKNIRTRDPITYITPKLDIRKEGGWDHYVDGEWTRHTNGPLYCDPYPLSDKLFLVTHNPDKIWNDPGAYSLYLLEEGEIHTPIYRDGHWDEDFAMYPKKPVELSAGISCWQPMPLKARKKPPVPLAAIDENLAKKGLAACIVQDVHFGMKGIEMGTVKFLRIMEQVPRPWSARHFWDQEGKFCYHTDLVSKGYGLALKVTHGVVPVESDGSAYFTVAADKNIYFQALDENYMEIQRERTYVNYRPGEVRSCVGCHEMPSEVPKATRSITNALKRGRSTPGPQPGDKTAKRTIDYRTDVQPILDKHCVSCHHGKTPADGLDLSDNLTRLFTLSYENLLARKMIKSYREVSGGDGVAYSHPKKIGSHASKLVKVIEQGCTGSNAELTPEEMIKIVTWIDASAQYYGSYYGRRNIKFKDHPDFRPIHTFQQAVSPVSPLKEQFEAMELSSLADAGDKDKVFLLPYFLDNGQTGVYLSYSRDGLKFEWLNDGKVVLPAPSWPKENLTRDPSIVYHEGVFHMVWTTSWKSRSIGYAHSKDLVNWSTPKKIDVWGDFTAVKNTWAPELHFDPEKKEFLIIWSSTTLAELNDGDGSANGKGQDHRTYAIRTRDFKAFTKPKLFYSPQSPELSVIDPYIAYDESNDRWAMVIKNEMSPDKGGKNLRLVFAESMQGPYETKLGPPIVGAGTDIVDVMGEGPSLFKYNGLWHLYWDAPFSDFSYCLATSPDLVNWTNRSNEMTLPTKKMRHGTVLLVPAKAIETAFKN